MRKNLILLFEVALALAALVAGYIFVVGIPAIGRPIAAAEGPGTESESPHLLYLASEGTQRGQVNDETMRSRGVTPVQSWQTVRNAADSRPLEGLLIDATLIDAMNETDREWLQDQFHTGLVIVGLGTKDAELAQVLGLETLRSLGEGDIPLGSTDYRMVSSLILGQPDDVEKLEQADWLEQTIQDGGGQPAANDIKHPAVTSFSKSRGNLDSEKGVDELFIQLKLKIEGVHQTGLEYQKALENSEEK